MEFRNLKTFEVVATFMSFNRAADVLHCTQSTVSAQIKSLEDDLGSPVFERLGRRIALTPAGEELLLYTRRMLDYEKEIRSAIKGRRETMGMLSLRAPQSVAVAHLPIILTRFQKRYPRVGFDISNCGYHRLAEELRTGVIDAAFLMADDLDVPDLHTTVMRTEPLFMVASPSSDLAPRSALSLKDLAGHTLLLSKHDCGYRMELERSLQESGVEVAAIIELNSLEALIQCVGAGLGVALLPGVVAEPALKDGRLVALDWETPLETRLFLIRHRDKPLQGVFGAFIAVVEAYFGEQGGVTPSPAGKSRRGTADTKPRALRYTRRL